MICFVIYLNEKKAIFMLIIVTVEIIYLIFPADFYIINYLKYISLVY